MYIKNPNNWEYITSVKYINGKENIILNILILSAKQNLKKYFEENNLGDNICLTVSNSGYSNNKIKV